MVEMKNSSGAPLEFAKGALVEILGWPNVDKVEISSETLKDELGFDYHLINGVTFDRKAPFPIEWIRFYPPDAKYKDLYAVVVKYFIKAGIPFAGFCVDYIGGSSYEYESPSVGLVTRGGTPKCWDYRRLFLQSRWETRTRCDPDMYV